MISPHTPPGTKVVCIDASRLDGWDASDLVLGSTYTVAAMIEDIRGLGVAVVLYELPRDIAGLGWNPCRFRRLDLPECLTSLLNVTPVDGDMVASKADHQHPLPSLLASSSPYEQPLAGGSTLPEPPAFSQFV